MANRHFGNLADVFKHVALCEALATLRPGEYWESHAGAATYNEVGDIPAERAHGIHHVAALIPHNEALRLSAYGRIITAASTAEAFPIPGSTLLARLILGENIRRYLLCDVDADALQNVQQTLLKKESPPKRELQQDKLECVHDDGISVLRGAGVLLPEKWTSSTFAFIDPHDFSTPTDAGITPLELACELANRTVPVVLFYTFKDADDRIARQGQLKAGLEKARLTGKGTSFEGALKATPSSQPLTQWGFGLLALNVRPDAIEAIDQKLRILGSAYEESDAPGPWTYTRTVR